MNLFTFYYYIINHRNTFIYSNFKESHKKATIRIRILFLYNHQFFDYSPNYLLIHYNG